MAQYVGITLLGPWKKVENLFKTLAPNIKAAAIGGQRKIAEKYHRKILNHLRNQDISGWTPLNPAYADFKMAKYGHEDILIASWKYYNSISVWRSNNMYHVGVPRGIKYRNGNEVAKIAYIHETWSSIPGKPYRPLWGYTFNEDLGGLKGVWRIINNHIKIKLNSQGYKVRPIKL